MFNYDSINIALFRILAEEIPDAKNSELLRLANRLAEEAEPEGKWGQVLLRSGGVGIEWKNPVEGKEEELLRVLRDCYGFYPNAEDYAVNRIKAIWE